MFFSILYYGSMIILIPGIIFSIYASIRVKTTFNRYNRVPTLGGSSAKTAAEILLFKNHCNVNITHVSGQLTDNYNPSNETLSLSDSTYNSNSVAAVAVAAHEVGHVVQHQEEYVPLKIRTALVPVVNIGSRLALPVAILGVIIECLSATGNFGSILISIGIILYSLASIFALVTLPVEINASRRAKRMLLDNGLITQSESKQVGSVLYAAALTYFASLLVSLLYLLRFIILIASVRRKD